MEKFLRRILDSLSLREKIGQTVQTRLVLIDADTDEKLEAFFDRYPVGSIFAGPDVISRFSTPDKPHEILERCNRFSKVPLAVAGDLEHGGGKVQLPSQLALAATGNPEYAYNFGKFCALGGRAAGFTWTFSPEVDIALNWENPANNHRGMGDDPELIATLGAQIVRGLQDNFVSAGCKHFPGDGSDFRDQHIGFSVNRLSRERWMATYGKIYRKMIEAGTHSIMPGHISLPFMDPSEPSPRPATLSRKICTDLLRGELGFDGVLVSDALVMGGFNLWKTPGNRVVECFKAGLDVMLWPELDYFDAMEKELEAGNLSEARLDESVMRILRMKAQQGLFTTPPPPLPETPEKIDLDGNAFGDKIACEGAVLLRNKLNILPLAREKVKKVLLWFAVNREEVVERDYRQLITEFEKRGAEVEVRINGNCLELRDMEREGKRFDAVIFLFDLSMHATLNTCRIVGPAAECLWTINWSEIHHPIAVGLNTPYLIMENPALSTVVNTHCRGGICAKNLPKLLYGEVPFVGKSPVKFPDLMSVDYDL